MYTAQGDIFNLLFFIVSFGVFSVGYLARPDTAADMTALSMALLTFDTSIEISGLFTVGLLLIGILVAYIPMTHMSHFIAKYFTYHSVRWDDAVNRRGESIEAKLAECLTYKPTWAAAHHVGDAEWRIECVGRVQRSGSDQPHRASLWRAPVGGRGAAGGSSQSRSGS